MRRSALVTVSLGVVKASAARLLVARQRSSVLSEPSSRWMTTTLPGGMWLLEAGAFCMVRDANEFDCRCCEFKAVAWLRFECCRRL